MLFLFFFFGLAAGQGEPCGQPPSLFPSPGEGSSRVVNGANTQPGAFPWQLAFETFSGPLNPAWGVRCGAVLIHSEYALTAAHCVDGVTDAMRLVAGLWDKNERNDVQTITITQNDITIHPDYDGSAENLPNDIAIIHLPTTADTAHPNIQPICLPPSGDFSFVHNPNCYITGWGFTVGGGIALPPTSPSQILQYAWIDMIGNTNCQLLWDTVSNTTQILDTNQCVKDQVDWLVGGTSACGVDMGGPAVCSYDGTFYLAGVGSFTQENCVGRIAQVYSSAPSYLAWITAETGLVPGPGGVTMVRRR